MKTDLVVSGYCFYNNKVLLTHHKKLDKWLPPGGHIHENETPDDALVREFREETDLDITILNKNEVELSGDIKRQLAVPFYVNVHNVGDHDHCCLYYLCKSKNADNLKLNKYELKDYSWFSLEDLEKDFVPADVRNIAKMAFKCYESLKV